MRSTRERYEERDENKRAQMMSDGGSLEETPSTSGLLVPPSLAAVLRPHQIDALHFLWRKLVEEGIQRVIQASPLAPLPERVRLYQEVFGCIVGHSMGLGKTVTILSFLLLLQQHYTVSSRSAPALRAIVLTPRSCTYHWQCTAKEWMLPALFNDTLLPIYVPLGSRGTETMVLDFYRKGGILFLGYEEYQKLLRWAKEAATKSQGYTRVKSVFDYFRPPLPLSGKLSLLEVLESPDVVILDESHRLKRVNSKLVGELMEHLRGVQLRVALTGTPLQNHLEEYNVMYSVVTGAMMQSGAFRRLFTIPIERGQCVDSTFQQFVEMQKCVASLRRFFAKTMHHCGPEVLEQELPPRREYVILVGLSPTQEAAYRAMLKHYIKEEKTRTILPLYHEASHVCFHPSLTSKRVREATHSFRERLVSQLSPNNDVDDCKNNGGRRSFSLTSSDEVSSHDFNDADIDLTLEHFNVAESPKLLLTVSLVWHIIEGLHEKVVLFSTYRSHLFLLKQLLRKRGLLADVMHGGLDVKDRQRIIERFTEDTSISVLLCSTKASGVGINLVAANHCILFDVSWNPADDTQATYRLYRYGQQRPVTVYRIATDGTFEHVVFFYALSKTWLHKKIVDVADPTRYERHMKENFFIYPCRVPIDFERSGNSEEKRSPLPNNDAVQKNWREYATSHCPALALTEPDGTFAWIRSISEHSFLLRDDTDEVIREMGKRFETQKQRLNLPIVMETMQTEDRLLEDVHHSLLERCEGALHDCLCDGAARLLSTVQRQSDAFVEDKAMDSAESEKLLCGLFATLVGVDEPAEGLTEIFAVLFHRGVEEVMRTVLSRPSYTNLRAAFSSRLVGDNLAKDSLLDSLRFRPYTLFSRMKPVEATYVLTEMGFVRPFVPHCILLGVSLAFHGVRGPRGVLQALCRIFVSSGGRDDGEKSTESLAVEAEKAVTRCIEGIWPPCEGMTIPEAPADLEVRRCLTERAYRTARERTSGFFSLKEAAKYLGLRAVHGRRDLYHCKRCSDGLLDRTPPDAVLRCGRCHYNAEFDLQTCVDTRHACTLYQLSVLLGLLDAFSVSRSFTTAFVPSACRDVLQVLRQLRHSHTVEMSNNFVSDAVSMGIDVLISGLPEKTVTLLCLQCGVTDMTALKSFLVADSSRVWSAVLRSHVRQLVMDWFKATTAMGPKAQAMAMPEMTVVLALQSLARKYGGGGAYAKDLLLGSTQGQEALKLRFICDGLVKLIYAERLLANPLTRATLDAFMMEYATPSESSDGSGSENSDHKSSGGRRSRGSSTRGRRRGEFESCSNASCSSNSLSVASVSRRVCARKRRRHASQSSSSYSNASVASSSFSSCYSDDDDGENTASDSKSVAERARRELIESEEVLRLRSVQYWAAYCEVYGTCSIESLTVMVEDEENGMTILPPPPNSFWVSEMKRVTREGMRLDSVVNEFLAKVMALSTAMRVIK
ncbi:hypothetical protein BCY84_14972 [Trypanosoma cruzi cruzi]|nr:hypothetical protein BCY84_14972 [Trypanosoma cruzi cruzi]